MCATRVGTLSLRFQTDESAAGLGHGTSAAWQEPGLGRQAWATVMRMMGGRRRAGPAPGLGHMARDTMADRYADDLESERAALESQGMRTVARTADLCVMEAPGGHRFFVVAPSQFDTL